MRKAAKIGGVHIVYIDRLSSEFARKIETISLPISVMGQRCGIYGNNYFTKILKKYTTITPKQFKIQNNDPKNIKKRHRSFYTLRCLFFYSDS